MQAPYVAALPPGYAAVPLGCAAVPVAAHLSIELRPGPSAGLHFAGVTATCTSAAPLSRVPPTTTGVSITSTDQHGECAPSGKPPGAAAQLDGSSRVGTLRSPAPKRASWDESAGKLIAAPQLEQHQRPTSAGSARGGGGSSVGRPRSADTGRSRGSGADGSPLARRRFGTVGAPRSPVSTPPSGSQRDLRYRDSDPVASRNVAITQHGSSRLHQLRRLAGARRLSTGSANEGADDAGDTDAASRFVPRGTVDTASASVVADDGDGGNSSAPTPARLRRTLFPSPDPAIQVYLPGSHGHAAATSGGGRAGLGAAGGSAVAAAAATSELAAFIDGCITPPQEPASPPEGLPQHRQDRHLHHRAQQLAAAHSALGSVWDILLRAEQQPQAPLPQQEAPSPSPSPQRRRPSQPRSAPSLSGISGVDDVDIAAALTPHMLLDSVTSGASVGGAGAVVAMARWRQASPLPSAASASAPPALPPPAPAAAGSGFAPNTDTAAAESPDSPRGVLARAQRVRHAIRLHQLSEVLHATHAQLAEAAAAGDDGGGARAEQLLRNCADVVAQLNASRAALGLQPLPAMPVPAADAIVPGCVTDGAVVSHVFQLTGDAASLQPHIAAAADGAGPPADDQQQQSAPDTAAGAAAPAPGPPETASAFDAAAVSHYAHGLADGSSSSSSGGGTHARAPPTRIVLSAATGVTSSPARCNSASSAVPPAGASPSPASGTSSRLSAYLRPHGGGTAGAGGEAAAPVFDGPGRSTRFALPDAQRPREAAGHDPAYAEVVGDALLPRAPAQPPAASTALLRPASAYDVAAARASQQRPAAFAVQPAPAAVPATSSCGSPTANASTAFSGCGGHHNGSSSPPRLPSASTPLDSSYACVPTPLDRYSDGLRDHDGHGTSPSTRAVVPTSRVLPARPTGAAGTVFPAVRVPTAALAAMAELPQPARAWGLQRSASRPCAGGGGRCLPAPSPQAPSGGACSGHPRPARPHRVEWEGICTD